MLLHLRGHFLSNTHILHHLKEKYKSFIIVLDEKSHDRRPIIDTRTYMEIDGAKLRSLRKSKLWLIGDLADKSGVHRNQISTYELGKAGAHPDTIRKLAAALGVEPQELVGR